MLTVFLVAFAVRMAFGIGTILVTDAAVIPDEYQYLDVAEWASQDRLGPEVWQGYGRSMYGSVDAFLFPLTILFKIFWPWRLFGHILAALGGAGVAAVAARLALSMRGTRAALTCGLLIALIPSQVLWSGVVLRESAVWIGTAIPTLLLFAATKTRSSARLLLLGIAAIGCVYWLGNLRDQTAFAVAWSIAAAALVVRAPRRVVVPLGAVAVAVVSLWLANLGPGGADLIRRRAPSLATVRAQLAVNAESAFVQEVVSPGATLPPAAGSTERPNDSDKPDGEAAIVPPEPERGVPTVTDSTGTRYVVDESASADLAAIPRGLVATMLRPFPWESTDGIALLFARLENLGWYVLYALAIVGAWVGRRRRDVLAYPIALALAIALIAALTQGNLGTAFRHRGQLMWALGLLASMGALDLIDRRRRRRSLSTITRPPAAAPVESAALIGR